MSQSKKRKPVQRPLAAAQGPSRESVAPLLLGIVYFCAVSLCSPATAKLTALLLYIPVIAAIVMLFLRRERVTAPLICLALVCLMGGISTLYAVSGKFALSEFLKVLCAFNLTLMLMGFSGRQNPGRSAAQVLASSCAMTSLVSIDLISTRGISNLFTGFFNGWVGIAYPPGTVTADYAVLKGVEPGVRMISMFENGNIFAGVAGLGVLLSLGLAASETAKGRRAVYLCLLYVNALAFVLAFSMGASGAIALAFLAFLLLEHPQRRAGSLVLMAETLILTVLAAMLISQTSFHAWTKPQFIPMLCVMAGAAGLWALDTYGGSRLAERLKGKVVLQVTGILLALLVLFALLGYKWTTGVSMKAGDTLRRAAYPAPGQYTLVAADVPLQVMVESQDQQETIMHTSTVLYNGPVSGASFQVPENSKVVYFNLWAQEDLKLDSLKCQGESKTYKIPLKYPLLPGFIANRLQGLWANENAIQRLVFFSDGMKIFRRSPVVGLGMGAFENAIRSVQSFDYETKYAHNHYIQCLAETGVIGLVLFVGLLAVSAAAVILSRRKKDQGGAPDFHPLVPALGAALVFMAVHAATEVVFSTYGYLPIAFGTFGVIALCCGEAVKPKCLSDTVRIVFIAVVSLLLAAFFCLLFINYSTDRQIKEKQVNKTLSMTDLALAARDDPYEWADYALSYVNNTLTMETVPPAVQLQADEFAQRLAKKNSNTIPRYLAEYYFATNRPEMGFAMIEKFVSYVSSSNATWNAAVGTMANYDDHTESYHQEMRRILQMLDDWNRDNMGTIVLDPVLQEFLEHLDE